MKFEFKNLVILFSDVTSHTGRSEFWRTMAVLIVLAVAIVALHAFGLSTPLAWIMAIFIFIPSQTLAIRRFNDAGLSIKDYLIFVVITCICAAIAYLCRASGYTFAMAVALWFMLGCVVALVLQFFRSSK